MSGILICGVLAFFSGLWMAIKVGQQSAGLGILTFFVPPVGVLYALKEGSVRLPAVLWVVAVAGYIYSGRQVAVQMFDGMDQTTIDAIARGDELTPEQQAQLDANIGGMIGAMPEQWGGEEEDEYEVDETAVNAIAIRLRQIERKRGTIMLSEARASVEIPTHFRFLEGKDVRAALGSHADAFPPGFLGWVVHESVDLSDSDQWQWAIDVVALTEGHMPAKGLEPNRQAELAREAEATAARIAQRGSQDRYHTGFGGYRAAPALDATRHTAAWVSDLRYADGVQALRCQAIRLGRKTQVVYRIPALEESADELCLREVRLLANSTRFITDQDYPQVSVLDGRSGLSLVDLATDKDLERRARER